MRTALPVMLTAFAMCRSDHAVASIVRVSAASELGLTLVLDSWLLGTAVS
jgi:hypothetical protein